MFHRTLPNLVVLFTISAHFASANTVSSRRQRAVDVDVTQRDKFISCAEPHGTEAHVPGSPSYLNLSKLGFRNDHASPAAIVLARIPEDVSEAVRCARRHGFTVCARSGGHSLVGKSLCNGVLIDVRPMRHVSVSPNGVANVQAGATLGEALWAVHQHDRWLGAGVCPGVGVSGYFFGGGHGPYEGTLGVGCDNIIAVTLVDYHGKIVEASKHSHSDLFWGLCGAGGGQFGIVTSFRIRTVQSGYYDRGVVFRFNWKQSVAGRVMEKWMDYDDDNGGVWFRMVVNMPTEEEKGLFGIGACYNVGSVEECMDRLKKGEYFNIPGISRNTTYISKVSNALDLHAFFGPEGGWGRHRPAPSKLQASMLDYSYADKGKANERTYQSALLRKGSVNRPSAAFWQQVVDFCADSQLPSIPWIACEYSLFRNAIATPRNNAFAHRGADIITHYIIGGGIKEERLTAYNWMKDILAPYTTGVYLNYAELELKDYAEMYWGQSLKRLQALKARYDPNLFFHNPQPIPLSPKTEL